ncbi:MAG: hypothetical protein Q7T36_08590 [Fluviicoccus sp.]|uniref:hypothetical protein n=1 Tax=Fluviicoccus sp. TaxID=2003552 RepID=UPI0027195973|nr:hypothetical protein [Fluviicoccus sp.]MDO8330512.1 hypothetical protein [Fluviicoccus sp.]
MSSQKIRCNGIRYRQGFIEVVSGIHPGHINVEVWNIHPDWCISDKSFDDHGLGDEAFGANVELELNMEQARALIEQLEACIRRIEGTTHNDA